MPRQDGTGPEGKGSGTGRNLGKCSDAADSKKLITKGEKADSPANPGIGGGRGRRLRGGQPKE
jgi:hypothetical protein